MKTKTIPHSVIVAFALALSVLLLTANALQAASPSPEGEKSAQQQIAELQAKVKQLEAAVAAQPWGSPAVNNPGMAAGGGMQMGRTRAGGGINMQGSPRPAGSMPGMSPGGGMNMQSPSQPGEMQGMQNMMGHMDQMTGMNMMGMHPTPAGSPGMSMMPQSALPGFPGVSHLYHIGATGFFLDHAEHINLTPDQQTALSNIKQQAIKATAHSEHEIQQAENELATLTSSDQPNAGKIQKKVRQIEQLRSEERLAFIRAVGNAAKLLTDDQRKILVGAMQPNNEMPSPSPTMSPMSDM